jgi:hypothetical protein
LAIMGFEVSALRLWGGCSPTWVMPPAGFALAIFQIGFCFLPGWSGPQSPHFILLAISGMTGVTNMSHLLRWGPTKVCLGWPRTSILPVSASQVVRITSASYQCPVLLPSSWPFLKSTENSSEIKCGLKITNTGLMPVMLTT